MPRCLIVGCGCRGLALAGELRARGHVVRATTRRAEQRAAIEEAGFEAQLGDPDRVASIAGALGHVAIAYLLLGSARGDHDSLQALHSTRLQMLLSRMLDSTVRGIVYEAAGSLDADLLAGGAHVVRTVCEGSRIPYALLDANPACWRAWVAAAAELPERLLAR